MISYISSHALYPGLRNQDAAVTTKHVLRGRTDRQVILHREDPSTTKDAQGQVNVSVLSGPSLCRASEARSHRRAHKRNDDWDRYVRGK